jgi:hypothetical protein
MKSTNSPKLQQPLSYIERIRIERWVDDVNSSTPNYYDASTQTDDPHDLSSLILSLPDRTLNAMYRNVMVGHGFSPITGHFPGTVADDTAYDGAEEDNDEEPEYTLENTNGKRRQGTEHEDSPQGKLQKQ